MARAAAGSFKPPMRQGVGASVVVLPDGNWPTVAAFLAERFAHIGPQAWLARFQRGEVLDAHGQVLAPTHPYRAHQRVYYYRSVAQEPAVPFEASVLYQDAHLLVADKPHFLPVLPSGRYVHETLLVRLKRLGLPELSPIHRIDRETAGLVLFSVQARTRDAYQQLFRQRAVHKVYEAIAPWREGLALPAVYRSHMLENGDCPEPLASEPFFKMRELPGEPNSETHLQLLQTWGDLGHYQLMPVTGRKHQLRLHMAALGVPICNDAFYPVVRLGPHDADDLAHPLQLLAKRLSFTDPLTGRDHVFESQRTLAGLSCGDGETGAPPVPVPGG